ncbi:hypothetical protein [Streptomyces sp. Midd1]|uniref:hypothetical protein n=1 Tax=Streptomyces sp. Midd3 TaxID=3161191 RepID=UPI0034DB26A2
MVMKDERAEGNGDDGPERKRRDRAGEGPFAVFDPSTLVGGRVALPPAPAQAPVGAPRSAPGSAPVNGGSPAPPVPAPTSPYDDKARAPGPPTTDPGHRAEAPPPVFMEKLEEASPSEKRAKSGGKTASEKASRKEAAQQGGEDASAPESTITLWGGMGSGKSTLLAALSRAVQDPMYGEWNMWPEDHASQKFLSDLAHTLYRDRTFPPATLTEQRPVRFTLAGNLGGTRFARGGGKRWRRGADRRDLTEFKVTLRDLPGEAFDLRSQTGAALGGKLIKDLGTARAMVYVVDPVREWQVNGDEGPVADDARQNADFFTDVLGGVATEINMRGERHGNKLPHSIAVCLAKFDDDRVFRFACEQGNVRLNPRTGQPEVMDAKRLFDGLCHAFPHGSLREIQQQIEQYFAPERVGYFVCSAVGFWIDPERGFDFENPSLVNPVEDDVRLVAPPRPVNILEPFLFLRGVGPQQS